eukprot:14996152-Alexandrium_andersonii.AAC.1
MPVRAKSEACGTAAFGERARECSAALLRAHSAFVTRIRAKLRALRRGSKQWWRLSRELMSKTSKLSCPALRLIVHGS